MGNPHPNVPPNTTNFPPQQYHQHTPPQMAPPYFQAPPFQPSPPFQAPPQFQPSYQQTPYQYQQQPRRNRNRNNPQNNGAGFNQFGYYNGDGNNSGFVSNPGYNNGYQGNSRRTNNRGNAERNPNAYNHYCWTHGLGNHPSNSCRNLAQGHQWMATIRNPMGGNMKRCYPVQQE